MKDKLREYYGFAYARKSDDKLKRMLKEENVIKAYNSKPFSFRRLKRFKSLFNAFGDGSMITFPFKGSSLHHVSISDSTFLNAGCTILGGEDVEIGAHCWIGPNVTITTVSHPTDLELRKTKVEAKPVVIEDGVFIGAGATILPGVTIKTGAVIGAGAVVTKDVEPLSIVAGVPAKKIH